MQIVPPLYRQRRDYLHEGYTAAHNVSGSGLHIFNSNELSPSVTASADRHPHPRARD